MTLAKDMIPDRRLIVALLVLLVVRLVFAAEINFIEDEAYYRLWGLYPSYAYFDHAPMVGWWIAIGQSLWGDTEFGLRFLSPIAAFIGSFFVWRIAQLSFDRHVAIHAVILFNAMPLIGLGSVLMTPDVPSVFFWGLAIWTLVEWNRSNRDNWWIAFGIAAGLGLLSKYTNIFLGFGVLLWLATSGRWRYAVRAPQFYLAGFAALLLFSPIIYWNAIHDWASFSKQFGRLQSHDMTSRFFTEWIGGQILLISPIVFGFLIVTLISRQNLRLRNNPNAQLVMLSFLPMLAYFLTHVFSSRINANWTVPLYCNFAILAAIPIRNAWGNQRAITAKLAIAAAPLGYAMTAFVLIEALFPILPASNKNPVAQLRGYDELANEIHEIAKSHDVNTLLTNSYQITGQLSYHLKELSVFQLNERIRYVNMPQLETRNFAKPVLFIANEGEAEMILKKFGPCIASAERLQNIQRKDRGSILSNYEIWQIKRVDSEIFNQDRSEDCKVTP